MEKRIRVKAYLEWFGRLAETRKFLLEKFPKRKEVNSDFITFESGQFQILETALLKEFPGLEGLDYIITSIDTEGDRISVKNDADLQLVLEESAGDSKIYIEVQQQSWSKQVQRYREETSIEEHSGIICCCCHTTIKGFRYKCLVCPNFDMCSHCEYRRLHPAHDMLRISYPRVYPPYFFTRLHRLYETAVLASPTVVKSSPVHPSHHQNIKVVVNDEHNSGDIDLRSRSLECMSPDNQNIFENLPTLEELTRSMQSLATQDLELVETLNFGQTTLDGAIVHEKEEVEENKRKNIDLNEKSGKNKTTDDDISEATHENLDELIKQHSYDDITREIISDEIKCINTENVIAALDNGNKKEVDISFRSLQSEIDSLLAPLSPVKETNIQQDSEMLPFKENTKPEILDNNSTDFHTQDVVGNTSEIISVSKNSCDVQNDDKSNKQVDLQKNPSMHLDSTVKDESSNKETSFAKGTTETYMNKTIANTENESSSSELKTERKAEKSLSFDEFLLRKPRRSISYGAESLPSSYNSAYSRYNTLRPTARVTEALGRMQDMGFTDDDGWLTQLLVMKHGDISQVLDLLTPVKK